MSAIAGIFNLNAESINPADENKIMQPFEQYPADDLHTWSDEGIFLGCMAQWITPESRNEVVPFYDYSRQLVITTDAIIDNRDELFNLLQINQHARSDIGDSQLILLAYDRWREETPKYLLGDFAFVIYDVKNKKIFGARDFSGTRTLYFFYNENKFAFSTTIKPLLTLPYVQKELNEEWLAEFLAIPNLVESVDMSTTVYKSVHQIPPSHSITISKKRVSLKKYTTVLSQEKMEFKSEEEYEQYFQEVFQQAVKARIRTYGEVGAHLSGGLDSGTVVSFAASELKNKSKKLHTFSYIPERNFEDWTPKYYAPNESEFIKETVKHVGNVNDSYLSFEGINPLIEVDNFLELMEMPYKFFENSYWLEGITKEANQNGVKVLLNGARGNHSISWGSWGLNMEYYASLLRKLKWLKLFHELDLYTKNFNTGKSNLVPAITRKAFPSIVNRISKNDVFDQTKSLINPSFAAKTNVYQKIKDYGMDISGEGVGDLSQYRKEYYRQLYRWNKSGVATTKLSLRYSVWDRDPTNDLRVINYCLSLPVEKYAEGGMERSFIRNATKKMLPDQVRLNHKIRGLQAADTIHRMIPTWEKFLQEIQQVINDKNVEHLFNVPAIKQAFSLVEKEPRPDLIFTNEFKLLTRSLIVYRFLKSF
ncbi:asparagine synthetase B family protein [Guptibacillus sedimenti]|uniref:asparagine synthetase B family protein n=1 Tax=Guptibacillus sedimenti TaxID=3025680 RepID=UPI00235F2926|nr:asparagine synthetase B [Pseudalkalibacillus sedimenti]